MSRPKTGKSRLPSSPIRCREGAEYQALIERVMANEIIRDKMLSPDGKLTLMVLALEPAATGPDRLNKVVDEIRNEVRTSSGRAPGSRASCPACR